MWRQSHDQIERLSALIREASQRPGVSWNRVTRLSLALTVLFFGVLYPALAFWIGVEYEATRALLAP